jgi:hypothetical protein
MASYKTSVENFCKDCAYDETEPGSWRKQVEECGCSDCPLWEVRPKTMATIEKERGKPIKVKKIK